MAINEVSTHGALLTNILQEAIFTASERSIAGNLVTVYDMTGTPGLTAQIPVYPEVSAAALTENTDLTAQTSVNPTSVTITASELGVRADLTDLLMESSGRDVAADIGTILGNAIGEKIDTDVFSQFDSLTNVVGTGGAEVTPAKVLQAVYTLRGQNAPTDADGDYYCVISPNVAYNIASTLTTAGFASGGATALSNVGNEMLSSSAYMGKIYNVKVFMSTTIANDSANDSVGAVFSPQCFGHVIKRPIVVREQRDESARATEYVATTARGNAILKNAYGVKLKGESTIN